MSFEERELDFVFAIHEDPSKPGATTKTGTFSESGTNALELSACRAEARITNVGQNQHTGADITIYGMTMSQMAQLTKRPTTAEVQASPNTVTVRAGTRGKTKPVVFVGNIMSAQFDGSGSPETPFRVRAMKKYFEALKPEKVLTKDGDVDAATLLEQLAPKLGCSFENNGVTGVMINCPYYGRTAWEQAVAIVQDAGIEWNACEGDVLAIWPRGGYRKGRKVIMSPKTGLVGYPTLHIKGIRFTCLFSPSISVGTLVEMKESIVPLVNGTWKCIAVDHDLSAYTPRGPWFTNAICDDGGPNSIPLKG